MSGAAIELLELLVVANLRVIALLAIVAATLNLCGRRVTAPARRDVWRIALAGCVVMPVLGSMLPAVSVPVLPSLEARPTFAASPVADAVASVPARESSISIAALFLLIYLAGVALVAARHGRSLIKLRRFARTTVPWADPAALELLEQLRRRFGIRRKLELRASRRVASALGWGWPTTHIVLPAEAAGWDGNRLRDVLVHELCHVLRGDWWWLHAGKLIGALYWLNPAVAGAMRQHELEMEKACDECVVSAGGNGVEYAEHLVELMSGSRRKLGAGIALGQGHFRRRIRAILDFSKEQKTMSKTHAHVAVAVAIVSVLALSAIELTSAQPALDRQSGQSAVAPAAAPTESERFETLVQESNRLVSEFNRLDQALWDAFQSIRASDGSEDGDAAAGLDERLARVKSDLTALMKFELENSPGPPDRQRFERQLAARTDLTPEERSLERYNFELRAVVDAKRAALERLEADLTQRTE